MKCNQCHQAIEGYETFCSHCGAMIKHEEAIPAVPTTYTTDQQDTNYNTYTSSSNSTTLNDYTVVPDALKKWNWGAFMFNVIWGIGNHSYLPLLCLIPFFNIVWFFVCGFKGNEWAYRSGKFKNESIFLATQETWNRAGFVAFIFTLIIIGLYLLLVLSIFGLMAASF